MSKNEDLAVIPSQNTEKFYLMLDPEAHKTAKLLADSDMVPKDFKGKPGNVLAALQWGHELGLSPMQALQNIAVVNGRPCIWGDLMIALVKRSAVCEDVHEFSEGEGDQMVAVCVAKRRGMEPNEQRFSVADAKKAGLWGKQGPWTNYPKRMLQMRARGFALRDAFPDVLSGLISREEAEDYPITAQNQSVQKSGTKATKVSEPINAEFKSHVEPLQLPTPMPTWLEHEIRELGGDPVALGNWYRERHGVNLGDADDDAVSLFLETLKERARKKAAQATEITPVEDV